VQALGPQASVESQVFDVLRELIVTDKLKGGTRLRQRELADRLHVSQTPIRAGLNLLERDGLITIQGKGRALVRHLTREDLEELYALRRGVEGLAGRLGAAEMTDDLVVKMEDLLGRIRDAAGRADVGNYLALRWDFHSVCYDASGRRRLVAEVKRLFWRGERYHRLLLSNSDRFARSLGWYERFLVCCKAHDGASAERVIEDSMSWGVCELTPLLPSEAEVYPT
jgi:DNA-binding GntR family transcriptional regulator